jgi:copper chaperone
MVQLKVTGMSCDGCANSVKKSIQRVYPEANVDVDLATGRVSVNVASDNLDVSQIDKAIRLAGFGVEVE